MTATKIKLTVYEDGCSVMFRQFGFEPEWMEKKQVKVPNSNPHLKIVSSR